MSYGRNNSDNCQLTYFIYDFDYSAVESLTGFDKQEVMVMINDYDDRMDEIGVLGYLEIGYVLAEAIVGVVSEIKPDGNRHELVATDYFALFSDLIDEGDIVGAVDDALCQASTLCYRIHNFLVAGLTTLLDYEERSYLAAVLVHECAIPAGMNPKILELTDDSIIITCGVPHELDEDEDSIQRLHASIAARINRGLSNRTRRGGTFKM